VNRRFEGTYRLHLQGKKIRERGTSVSRWQQISLADFPTLKMEVIRYSETSIHTRSTQRHIPEEGILYIIFVGITVLTAVTAKSSIFWDVTPYDPEKFTDISEERKGSIFRTGYQAGLLQDYMAHSMFVCCLFTDMVSNTGYTASNDCATVNNVLDGMWKEAVVA
jgi:hypothetical protein